MIKEFKEFISKGNVMDMAVGIIIGGAFSSIVTSLVNDILMPIIGVIIGGIDFTNLTIKVGDATIKYGNFIQNIINFLIIAFCLFLIVKALNKLSRLTHHEEKEETKETEIDILKDIRKELKTK